MYVQIPYRQVIQCICTYFIRHRCLSTKIRIVHNDGMYVFCIYLCMYFVCMYGYIQRCAGEGRRQPPPSSSSSRDVTTIAGAAPARNSLLHAVARLGVRLLEIGLCSEGLLSVFVFSLVSFFLC